MDWPDGRRRCRWANPKNERYVRYHDGEWGVPLHDEKRLFELLTLECFQAGLSWECVLNKREAFRRAFGGFDPGAVAAYGEEKLRALQNDPGIIRNERKIRAAVGNARVFLAVERGVWQLRRLSVGLEPAAACCTSEGLSRSPLSEALARDLRRRGMRFFRPHRRLRLPAGRGRDQRPRAGVLSRAARRRGGAEISISGGAANPQAWAAGAVPLFCCAARRVRFPRRRFFFFARGIDSALQLCILYIYSPVQRTCA